MPLKKNVKLRLKMYLLFLVLFYLGICFLIYLTQGRLIYHPSGPPTMTPAHYQMSYENCEISTNDGLKLQGWWLPVPDAQATIIVCHGNAGNIENRLPLAVEFQKMNCNVLLFDYRGYGASQGKPSELGTYHDAQAAYAYALKQFHLQPEKVVIYGESLGAAVAIEIALHKKIAALILESPFTSIADLGARIYPWLPVRYITRFQYNNLEKIDKLEMPMLIIHSPEDSLVPYTHGQKLFNIASATKQFLSTSGGHNDGGFRLNPGYIETVQNFIITNVSAN